MKTLKFVTLIIVAIALVPIIALFWYICIPLFIIGFIYLIARQKKFSKKFQVYVKQKGYSFNPYLDSLPGIESELLISFSHTQVEYLDLVSGSIKNRLFRFFTFQSLAKDRTNFVVLEMETKKTSPKVILFTDTFMPIESQMPYKNKIVLEGDFNKHLNVYTPPDQPAIDTLTLLSPDVMQNILEVYKTNGGLAKIFCIEFTPNKIYLIRLSLSTIEEFEQTIESAEKILSTFR